VDGAEDVVERNAGVEFFEPGLDAGIVVALEAEAHVEAAGELLAGGGDELDVVVVLLGRHAHGVRDAVGQRAVAGDDDALQAAREGLGGVFHGFTVRVFAQRGVAVGFVEEAGGHGNGLKRLNL
jgi:hypothetical protein